MDEPEATDEAKARALSSPLRMRILRFCLHESHTNREIAEEFGLNPGTSLHHVRTLLSTGFLAAEDPRPGRRGATEIPYLATRRSWRTHVPGISSVLIQAFLDEVADVPPDDVKIARLGLLLNPASQDELEEQLLEVLNRFRLRPPDEDGRPISVMTAVHPEARRRRAGQASGSE